VAKSYCVYVLSCESKRTGATSTHIGIAIDPTKRLKDHNSGRVKATSGRVASLLGYTKPMSHGDALRLEMKLKKLSRIEKRLWIEENKI
jgi:putative endonuclease